MDQHKSYDKEELLKSKVDVEGEEKKEQKKEKFIWSYIIKPVRKDFFDK